jgi:hypothetical protein
VATLYVLSSTECDCSDIQQCNDSKWGEGFGVKGFERQTQEVSFSLPLVNTRPFLGFQRAQQSQVCVLEQGVSSENLQGVPHDVKLLTLRVLSIFSLYQKKWLRNRSKTSGELSIFRSGGKCICNLTGHKVSIF